MPFFRKRQQRLAQELELFNPHRQFICFRAEKMSPYSDNVAEVQKLEKFVSLFAYGIQSHVNLQPHPVASNMRKRCLPVRTQPDNSSRHLYVYRLGLLLLGRAGG